MASASVRVEKATSDLLIGPDWTMNMDICDSINSDHWLAKDVVKTLKKRLQHKNPKVQFLALTLLETMIKNCGDYLHLQVAERNILQEMIKIVKKKTDMQVRDKILMLLDSWQEAFGGPNGRYPQYYWAYDELRRYGVEFPQRLPDAAPIFTPPVTHPPARHLVAGSGMPSNATLRLDEAMASEMESLSLSSLDSFRSVMELFADMLQAVNPNDKEAVKDEVIADLASQCRSNQTKLMQLLSSTGDEELLGQGLELNDNIQSLLAKHDAIASGSPLPLEMTNVGSRPGTPATLVPSELPTEAVNKDAQANGTIVPVSVANDPLEEDDEDDEFAQLARRPSKISSVPPQSTGSSRNQVGATDSTSDPNKALALPDPPTPVRTAAKEQDMIDLLSITLSTNTPSPPHTPLTPLATATQTGHQVPVSPSAHGYPSISQPYPVNHSQVPYNSYVAPWAQSSGPPQAQFQPQSQLQFQSQSQPQFQSQPQPQLQPHSQPQFQPPSQPLQSQFQYPQYSSMYPPPPWAIPSTPGYNVAPSNPYHSSLSNSSQMPANAARPLQQFNSFGSKGNNATTYGEAQLSRSLGSLQQLNSNLKISGASASPGEAERNPKSRPGGTVAGQKPFIPSYRLFEDLIDVRNPDGLKTSAAAPTSLAGSSGQSMLGGRK